MLTELLYDIASAGLLLSEFLGLVLRFGLPTSQIFDTRLCLRPDPGSNTAEF